MKPPTFNIEIYQGDTFSMFLRIRALDANGDPGNYLDLTGSTAKAQVRANAAADPPDAEFTCTLGNQSTVPGSLFVELSPAQTAALTGNGVYDVQITHADGRIRTYLAGTTTLIKEVTRV
jgi:hypothetical protein